MTTATKPIIVGGIERPYEPDWIIDLIQWQPGWYPWRTIGHYKDKHGVWQHFVWSAPALQWRYVLADAEIADDRTREKMLELLVGLMLVAA